jgi:predicted HNH restriction endonuclease
MRSALNQQTSLTRNARRPTGVTRRASRFRREVNYFQRNPELARNAKEHYNYTCQICGFSPSGLFGNRFQSTTLECHHLDPMSERSDFIRKSTLADVIILCANCHRLVHSERRALSIEVAKSLFKKKPFTLGELL